MMKFKCNTQTVRLAIFSSFFCLTLKAQTTTFEQPKVLGEGIISSRDFEFNFTHTESKELGFLSKALLPDWRRISILTTSFTNGKWSEPRIAAFSGQYRDADPYLCVSQNKLLFISDRPSKYQKKPGDYAIWYVTAPFKDNNAKLLDGDFYLQCNAPLYPSMPGNGNLYFCYADAGKMSLYRSRKNDAGYGPAERLSFSDGKHNDLDPVIASDESFLIFVSNTRGGSGGSDLFVSFNKNGEWTEPVNLGKEINTFDNEGQPGLSPDNKVLYFSTRRNPVKNNLEPRGKQIDDNALKKELETIYNGLPNIFEVAIDNIYMLRK